MADEGKVETTGTFVAPKDAGKGGEGQHKYWMMAIQLASKQEKEWRERAKKVYDRYRQEGNAYDPWEKENPSNFNILWANTEVMRPALYHSTPKPDVRRRYYDKDPVGKAAAEIVERALTYSIDSYDFDHTMNLAVLDLLLPGRSVARVRYKALTKGDEEIVDQDARCEHVQWDDFRRGPGKTWGDVTWIAFRHYLTRREMRQAEFTDATDIELDWAPTDQEDNGDDADLLKKAEIWEIWDKTTRKVLFFAKSHKKGPVKEQKDPLGLRGFFPIPRPMYALDSSDSLVPVELYRLYKDQADELDRITRRINNLVEALKIRGIYDSTVQVMDQLMASDDNALLAAGEETLSLLQTGGLDRAIWLFPVEKIAAVLVQLYLNRDQIKQTIYEITGLSDILRGETEAGETLGAQRLKAQSGSRRMRRLQREVQRYARDLMQIKAEIMCEKFQPQILAMITGKDPADPVPVGVDEQGQEVMSQETPMDVIKADFPRDYRIDIETDSTIAEDEQVDQEAIVKLLDGITRYVAAVGPVVQQGYMPPNAAVGLLQNIVRRFKFGRTVEDALDDAQNQLQEEGASEQEDPEAQAAQAEIERENMKAQAQIERDNMVAQAEQQLAQARSQAEIQAMQTKAQTEVEVARMRAEAEVDIEQWKATQKSEIERQKAEAMAGVARIKARAAA